MAAFARLRLIEYIVVRPTETYFKLCQETAKIDWVDLARFFAQGRVLCVASGLDLPAVATAMADDDADRVSQWSDRGELAAVPDEVARAWFEDRVEVWAVTVAPYVLVQRITPSPTDDAATTPPS